MKPAVSNISDAAVSFSRKRGREIKVFFSFLFLQAVLEIHDEVAAQIQNCNDEVEYIDGVSSIEEEEEDEDDQLDQDQFNRDDAKSRLSSLPEDQDGEDKEGEDGEEEEEEEVKVDTFRVIGVRRLAGQCLVSPQNVKKINH